MDELNLRELLVRESEQIEWKENVADTQHGGSGDDEIVRSAAMILRRLTAMKR